MNFNGSNGSKYDSSLLILTSRNNKLPSTITGFPLSSISASIDLKTLNIFLSESMYEVYLDKILSSNQPHRTNISFLDLSKSPKVLSKKPVVSLKLNFEIITSTSLSFCPFFTRI